MSQAKVLIVKFQGWDEFKKKVTTALRKMEHSIQPRNVFYFDSVAGYQKFMSEQKLAILAVIIKKKPTSIYQLAQLVDRDFANVQRDCVALSAMGFIKLVSSKDAKGSKIPKLAFDYRKIIVQMPSVSYSHDLVEAA